LFDVAKRLRRGLPRKLTPELAAYGRECGKKAIPAMDKIPGFRQCICDAFDHKECGDLSIYVVLSSSQCESSERFATMPHLRSQMAFVTAGIMAGLPREGGATTPQSTMPPTHPMQHVPKVCVRLEVLLTRDEDCTVFEFMVLDPRDELKGGEEDLQTLRRRAYRETGLPKEKLDVIMDELLSCPKEQFESICSPYTRLDMSNAYSNQLRACLECHKYGITLLKCSGCRAAYYCGRECQVAHWPTHKGACAAKK